MEGFYELNENDLEEISGGMGWKAAIEAVILAYNFANMVESYMNGVYDGIMGTRR